MQRFTIKDIENLTGIKAHTLRIWEQRYPFFQPKRKESQHRFYDNDDLKKLLQIAFLYHLGWKISRIAALPFSEIEREVNEHQVAAPEHRLFVYKLIECALDFNEQEFTTLLNDIIGRLGFENCITKVCFPYLTKIGLLWSTNNVIPAQEHFSSYIIQNLIIAETQKLPPLNMPPEIVLFCPQQEFHELPLLYLNYLLRKHGKLTVYLGTNISLKELKLVAGLPGIKTLYLHLITNFTGYSIDEYLETLCVTFRDKQIIASGAATLHTQRRFTNVQVLKSDREIYGFVSGQQLT